MKAISLAALISCAVLFAACETTDKTGGSQEAKRQAAIERHRQQQPIDQSDANLWNAQQNVMNQDGNSTGPY